jgi:hypothetical protein
MNPTRLVLVLTLCSFSILSCRLRQTADSAASSSTIASTPTTPDNVTRPQVPVSCGSSESVTAVLPLAGNPIAPQAQFVAVSREYSESEDGAGSEQIWVMLLPRKPAAGESMFQIKPSINIAFHGWPEAKRTYSVSDDCFEPKRTENPVAVCGQLQVMSGEVTYSQVPTKDGGPIEIQFNFSDSQGQAYAGIAASCLQGMPSMASLQ